MIAWLKNIPFKLKRQWRAGTNFRRGAYATASRYAAITLAVYLGIKLAELF
jgi:hypothetical protein